jgi:saccharopine dehydrogenase (NADP+, L-glutamate forming)
MEKQILLIGAGKSTIFLIQFLKKKAVEHNWFIFVTDANEALAQSKWNESPNGLAMGLAIEDETERRKWISKVDLVISMLPANLHFTVAQDCVDIGKPLFTASYLDEGLRSLEKQVIDKGLLFMGELGLDPGIDHMSAMEIIHRIKAKGGQITSFKSHCGGLIAPESDTNPWHYKISWNPRNIILAGKAGALYLDNGKEKQIPYETLFANPGSIEVKNYGSYGFYPNRNSLQYIDTYQLQGIENFVRTTLRHPHFFKGWQQIVELGLTDETIITIPPRTSIKNWYQALAINNIQDTIVQEQFDFLKFDSDTIIPPTLQSNAAILQWILEDKWKLLHVDKDLIIMVHEFEYLIDGKKHTLQSDLVVKGIDDQYTAMAKTVGLPLAIAACLYLEGKIPLKGIHIPIYPEIYKPVLSALQEEGIQFIEH